MAILLAILSSACFGVALVTGRVGLRSVDARTGAAISIPAAALLLGVASACVLDVADVTLRAAASFALIGLFFPAVVTILTFHANDKLGPTVTSAVSGSSPLFALLAAAVLLEERVPAQAVVAAAGVAVGIYALRHGPTGARRTLWLLLWPFSGALVRGVAQAGARAALLLCPNPLAAALIGYAVSSAVVTAADRWGHRDRRGIGSHAVFWFGLTGVFNGAAVLLMYAALSIAPVSIVAPIVAAHPLVTAAVGATTIADEVVTRRMLAGAALTVGAIVYLLAST